MYHARKGGDFFFRLDVHNYQEYLHGVYKSVESNGDNILGSEVCYHGDRSVWPARLRIRQLFHLNVKFSFIISYSSASL